MNSTKRICPSQELLCSTLSTWKWKGPFNLLATSFYRTLQSQYLGHEHELVHHLRHEIVNCHTLHFRIRTSREGSNQLLGHAARQSVPSANLYGLLGVPRTGCTGVAVLGESGELVLRLLWCLDKWLYGCCGVQTGIHAVGVP